MSIVTPIRPIKWDPIIAPTGEPDADDDEADE